MGKRKRPADVDTVQYEQVPTRGRIVQTVQDKAGILYIQNDSTTSTSSSATSQQKQQSGHHQNTTKTTYYQIQTKVQDSEGTPGTVIHQHRTGNQVQVVQQQQQIQQQQQYSSEENSTSNSNFKCIKCSQVFESKDIFIEHCNQFHYFACDLCSNSIFEDLYQLNIHMMKHMNKYDMCEKCNMVCSSTDELKGHLGGHVTTYNRNEVVFTNSNGQVTLPNNNPLNDDSVIEHLAAELDQSIGSTAKIKPQKYRCGVCKQDFNDPKVLFKHMNVHINMPIQTQIVQQQQQQVVVNPSPPPPQPQQQQTIQLTQQQQNNQTATLQENVVYTNIESNNIYYDERTGQFYTIALMDNSSPLSEAGGSGQSVIEYVQDASSLQQGQHIEYVEETQPGQETIIIEDESQHSHISHHQQQQQQPHHQQPQPQKQIVTSHQIINSKQTIQNNSSAASQVTTSSSGTLNTATTLSNDPPPLVHITRDTDLEELIPTTTLVADSPTSQKISKQEIVSAKQSGLTKCENCHSTFVKKLPKQMFCHNCVTRNTSTAANKH